LKVCLVTETVFSVEDQLAVNATLPPPLYHQLFVVLKRKIEAGELRQGQILPSEIEMAEKFSVSRITAKRAMDDLATQGLVQRRRGRGTVVTHTYQPKVLLAPLNGMLDTLESMGRETHVTLLAFERVMAPLFVVEALRLPERQWVDHAVRVRSNSGESFGYYQSWTIPLGERFNAKALESTPRIELFRQAGVELAEVDQVLSAARADVAVAKYLEMEPGDPVLSVARTYFDSKGRAIDFLLGYYRPDRFHYHMRLSAKNNTPSR
jgi:GntR family transcriptional regulator